MTTGYSEGPETPDDCDRYALMAANSVLCIQRPILPRIS